MDSTSIFIAAFYFAVCALIWIDFRLMKDENIQQFKRYTDDNFTRI